MQFKKIIITLQCPRWPAGKIWCDRHLYSRTFNEPLMRSNLFSVAAKGFFIVTLMTSYFQNLLLLFRQFKIARIKGILFPLLLFRHISLHIYDFSGGFFFFVTLHACG